LSPHTKSLPLYTKLGGLTSLKGQQAGAELQLITGASQPRWIPRIPHIVLIAPNDTIIVKQDPDDNLA